MKKRALILSGGAIRGAFQAGAIKGVLDQGFEPDIIHGISAGALNGAFLVNEAGNGHEHLDWKKIGGQLEKIWLKEINHPDKVVRKRNLVVVIFEALFKRFKGFLNPKPLLKLIDRYVNKENLRNSPVEFLVGAVDFLEGDIEYPHKASPNFLDYIIASASMPIVLPHRTIRRKPYIDGGIRDVAPLRHVIKRGVDEIVIVVTQPKNMATHNKEIGNIIPYLERVIQLMLNEILLNDLAELDRINQRVLALNGKKPAPGSDLEGKRYIDCKIIWPKQYYAAKMTDSLLKISRRCLRTDMKQPCSSRDSHRAA